MTDPKVSVVVPVYDLGAYLPEAIQSVRAQTFHDYEIVVVDDGSTDAATKACLDGLSGERTRVLRRPHAGLASARNAGVAAARGEYLCALDADDLLAPTYLEKAVRALDAEPSLAFVSCWLRTFGEQEWDWTPARCDFPTLLSECTVCTAALVRRALVLDVGGFDGGMPEQGYEDWDLFLSLVERGHRGVILPEALFFYRRRKGSMSTFCSVGSAHLDLWRYLVKKHEASYRAHVQSVLAGRDGSIADLLRRNDQLERHLVSELSLCIERRRIELERLQARLHEARRALSLQAELAAARHEAAALRSSLSWRITGPLRALYDVLRRPFPRKP